MESGIGPLGNQDLIRIDCPIRTIVYHLNVDNVSVYIYYIYILCIHMYTYIVLCIYLYIYIYGVINGIVEHNIIHCFP